MKQLALLFGKVLTLFLTVLLFIGLISPIYLHQIQNRPVPAYDSMPFDVEIANTGTSHGLHAFHYEVTDHVGFNYAMDNQSLPYDYNLIDYYHDHLKKGSILFIPISYSSLWINEFEYDTFESKNQRYFPVLDIAHMRFRTKGEYIINKYFSAITVADKWLKKIVKSSDLLEELPSDPLISWEELGRERVQNRLQIIYKDGEIKPVDEINLEAIRKLIRLCQENDIKPILITTPYLEYFNTPWPEEVMSVYHGTMKKHVQEFGIEYWDYSNDERFNRSMQFFADTDHLNDLGGIRFTEVIIQDCYDRGILH